MRIQRIVPAVLMAGAAMACAGEPEHGNDDATAADAVVAGTEWTVRDTVIPARFEAAGVARPVAEATLSTKLMGEVVEVSVREGDAVAEGQPLVRIDASDLAAKRAQVEASIREAEAVVRDAETQAGRMRALYEEEAAPRVQLDAAETGLERARARLATARAVAAEVDATARYAVVRAPFSGTVTSRFVDPGDFAAPGAPMATVLDAARLRIVATAAPDIAAGVGRGDTLEARIEGRAATAVVEGVVPTAAGNLYTVNAIVENPGRRFLPGSAATLRIPAGSRRVVLIPADAVIRRGDLTGVRIRSGAGAELRWIRLGEARGEDVEVLAGLEPGEVILLPAPEGAVEAGAGVASTAGATGQRPARHGEEG